MLICDSILTESMEDYLEMFYRIVAKQGYIRPVDLSDAIKVKPSSVTRMIQKLHKTGFITYEKYRNISLTEKGMIYGRFLVWRDEKLTEFLSLVKASPHISEQVEGMEHYITPITMRVISNLNIYFRSDPKRLSDLESIRCQTDYPDHEDLRLLRAWLFRHETRC
ncbi:MAG: transcriptional regulator MntR [Firmicutes bacterium]|nr:transcriptional regulator MntR [Bacillota bacterium]